MNAALLLALSIAAGPAAHETAAKQIEAALIAPCCWRQQVSVHTSPAADRIRRDVRARLAAGQTRDEILRAYEAEHGPAILAEPPARGSTLLLYLLPPLAFAGSAGLLVSLVRRFVRSAARAPVETPSTASDPRLGDRLEDELAELD